MSPIHFCKEYYYLDPNTNQICLLDTECHYPHTFAISGPAMYGAVIAQPQYVTYLNQPQDYSNSFENQNVQLSAESVSQVVTNSTLSASAKPFKPTGSSTPVIKKVSLSAHTVTLSEMEKKISGENKVRQERSKDWANEPVEDDSPNDGNSNSTSPTKSPVKSAIKSGSKPNNYDLIKAQSSSPNVTHYQILKRTVNVKWADPVRANMKDER